jgi:hypothetical protein
MSAISGRSVMESEEDFGILLSRGQSDDDKINE